ncbi:MAG TPA: efflux RND transporter periplasmic adaptor subunit [Pseudonocardiaceae bacterium]|nr:efflux RND transporter periplasmic adaptor subunit [Pseudonocardiaceae bacterium]
MNATDISALAAGPEPPTKRPLKRSTRIGLVIVTALVSLQVLGFGGTYLLFSRHYVSTDNAQIDGDRIDINAPVSGILVGWTVTQGSVIRRHQILGRIRPVGAGAQAEQPIKANGAGTVAAYSAVEGQYVTSGETLAGAYDDSNLYITARVNESDIGDVVPGMLVDVKVDAYPDTPVTGIVQQVQNSAAGEFTIYPASNQDPTNPQRVDQYIPVRIELTATHDLALAPGMNVTVHIHKQ